MFSIVLLLSGCSSLSFIPTDVEIPDVEMGVELPFEDCPESVSISIVSRTRREYLCRENEMARPDRIWITSEGAKDILLFMDKMCRRAVLASDQTACNKKVRSIADALYQLDSIMKAIIEGKEE